MNRCKLSVFDGPSLLPDLRSPKRLADLLLRLFESRAERDRSGLYLADGLRFVHRAVESPHARPAAFIYAREIFYNSRSANRLLDTLKERHPEVPLLAAPPELLRRVSISPEPQGICVLLHQSWTPLYRLAPDAGLCYVALDTVRTPGNLGTVLRTLEAVGGAGLIRLAPDPVPIRGETQSPVEPLDPFSPQVIRATMGSAFALRFARPTEIEWERWRRRHGVLLVGASPHATEDYRSVLYGDRVVLWIGGERKGLSEAQMGQCDRLVRIPMAAGAAADSLNLATATSVLLYELFNQSGEGRLARLGTPPLSLRSAVT